MQKIKIGITLGDINGIGPEIVLKTFTDTRILQLCTPIVYGAEDVIHYYLDLIKDEDGEEPQFASKSSI